MNAQHIHTTISYEQYLLMKKNNWKPSEVLKAGISALVKPSVLQEQLNEQKAHIEALKRKLKIQNTKLPSWSQKI